METGTGSKDKRNKWQKQMRQLGSWHLSKSHQGRYAKHGRWFDEVKKQADKAPKMQKFKNKN